MAHQERLIRQLLNGEAKPLYGSTDISPSLEQVPVFPQVQRTPSIAKHSGGASVKHADSNDQKSVASDTPQLVPHAVAQGDSAPSTSANPKADLSSPASKDGDGIVKGMVKTIEEAVKSGQTESSPMKNAEKKAGSSSTSMLQSGESNKSNAGSNFSTSMSWFVLSYFLNCS